jgi:SAM-dependent methyltransferase
MTAPAGQGPGHITADGCAVDVYVALPVDAEPDLIAAAVPAGSTVLELGAGAGRVTHELLARGYSVVAVDDSEQMLARIVGAETVLAGIEGLDLGRRFDAVLLCSHLINRPDAVQREEFVATCARHLAPGGYLVIERHDPAWFDTATEAKAEQGGIELALRDVSRPAADRLAATVEYRIGDRVWTQTFTAERMDDLAIETLLARHGLEIERFLDEQRLWIQATQASRPASL